MLISYSKAGALVLAPYLIHDVARALPESVAISLALLFLLGAVSAKLSGLPMLLRSLRMMLFGGLAIVLGIVVGRAMP